MTLIDDTFDCHGGRFDPMGDPILHRKPELGEWVVWCDRCEQRERARKRRATLVDLLDEHLNNGCTDDRCQFALHSNGGPHFDAGMLAHLADVIGGEHL